MAGCRCPWRRITRPPPILTAFYSGNSEKGQRIVCQLPLSVAISRPTGDVPVQGRCGLVAKLRSGYQNCWRTTIFLTNSLNRHQI